MAGSGLSGPHPTIANLFVIVTDNSSSTQPNPILLGSCTGTPNTTANVFQKGCILFSTDSATGITGQYTNSGTLASPVWVLTSGSGLANGASLFVLDTGNNAGNIVITSYSSGTVAVPLVSGLTIGVRLKNTMTAAQAATATVNFNHTTKNLRSANNPIDGINTGIVAGAVILMVYTPGQGGDSWQGIGY